jgi:hypothetical protein
MICKDNDSIREEIRKMNDKYPGVLVIIGNKGNHKGTYQEVDLEYIEIDVKRLQEKYPDQVIKFKLNGWVLWSTLKRPKKVKIQLDNLEGLKFCPSCGSEIAGRIQLTCSNPRCKNYASALFNTCYVCNQPRHSCTH